MRYLPAAAILMLALAGCTAPVALNPATDAANPLCAEVTVRLPETIGDLHSRATTAQATGAWGEPATVVLHCGVPVPTPTAELRCDTVDGVDWLIDGSADPRYVLTSYGREPAVEVALDSDAVSGRAVLSALASAVSQLPLTGSCVSPNG